MSVQSQQNVMNVLVGSNPTCIAIASVQITDPSTTSTYIADGQVIMLNHLDAPMQVASANVGDSPYVRFVQRSGTNLNFSPRIKGTDINTAKSKSYAAAQEQIWGFGYNGTTGSIDNTSTEYMFTIVYDHDDMMWSERKNKEPFEYFSTSPTQLSIAQSFSTQVNFMQARKAAQGTGAAVSAVMLSNSTTVSTPSAATTVAVVNGSDVATLNVADTVIQVIGAQLRLGSAAATKTGAVYVVVGTPTTDSTLTSVQVRLHTAFQGASVTYTLGTLSDSITAGTAYGVKVSGLALTWQKDFFKFKKVMFHFDMKNFGATTIFKTQESSLGNGDYRLVAEFESFSAGNEGILNRTRVPLPTGRVDTVTSATYDTFYVEWADKSKVNTVAASVPMKGQLYIFIPDGATGALKNETLLLSQLNPYLASTPAALPALTA